MKPTSLIPLTFAAMIFVALPASPASAQGTAETVPFKPPTFNKSRFNDMLEKSPFMFEVVPEVVEAPPEEDPLEDWSIVSYAEVKGVARATIKNMQSGDLVKLQSGETVDGFTLRTINFSGNIKDVEIEVEKGGKVGKIGVSDKQLAARAAAPQQKGGPPSSNVRAPQQAGRPQAPQANNSSDSRRRRVVLPPQSR
ncbi:MAG: hypothetical protein R3F11_25485 [Verrucomicrobiales bacterium]